MLRQMERSAIQLLVKRGKSIRQIARELGRSPTTIARALHEPVDRPPVSRRRPSKAAPYRPQIETWLREGLTAARMLELARTQPEQPYTGGHSIFRGLVRTVRLEQQQHRAAAQVPVRFEGLPAEYLQVDWGEVRRFPFTHQPPATRYFLACRLKYSRWLWVRFTTEMRQETLLRGLVDCCVALGWVPWVLVFDNMKTVTSGRDAQGQPLWTPALLQFAAEFGFHPQACSPGAGNQKGAVESLIKFVKGNFLSGRVFRDDADLARQQQAWQEHGNARPCQATGEAPKARLPQAAARGGSLPASATDYGFLVPGHVSREALVAVAGNRYSVPVTQVGAPVTVRLHRERVRIWRQAECVADHRRAPDGAHQRVIDVTHFAPLFGRKPRAQVMLYRDALRGLSPLAEPFLSELSRRHRERLGPQVLAVYALYQEFGASDLLAAMMLAHQAGTCSAEALALLLARPVPPAAVTPLVLPGVPAQAAIDRPLRSYEALVCIEAGPPAARVAAGVR
jgi:transposase